MDFPGGRSPLFRKINSDSRKQSMEVRAAHLHAENRRRADLFNRPVMVDSAMDIMLTALIAHEQGTGLTRTAAAMANRLARATAEPIIADLVAARLLRNGDDADGITLTPLGVDLMREFVDWKHPHLPS